MASTLRRVEFGDTDMAGIMYFANFFRFMEVAETDFLQARGLSVSWTDASGQKYGFPRVSVSCEFFKPARFGDWIHIEVQVEKVGQKSVQYRIEFRRDAEVLARGSLTSVYCKHSLETGMVSQEIPPEMRAALLSPPANPA